uniref:Hippocampus abundant transcript 1 protein n=1 Tax=Solanum tuberosum TaxID=4113 RepID=M1BPT4_SOLTU
MEGNISREQLKILVHLLLPLCIYWTAEEMSVSIIADITTNALCPSKSTCSQAIYINGLQQMVVGICKMVVIPVLGQLADEYGRKPLLLLIVSTAIFPSAILAIDESKGFVYAYYVLRIISHIMSQGSIFCISAAYAVSVALLIIAPVYMIIFLTETVKLTPNLNQHLRWSSKAYKLVQDRYSSMRYALHVYYLKSAFDFNKNQFSEILMMVGVGSIITQMLVFPLVNPLVGERVVLRIALLASITYALLYGLAWASWVPYFGALFRMVYVLERPSTNAIVSKASSSSDQGKTQGLVAGAEAIGSFLAPLVMSPLTSWFLSSNAPFNCKGFSLICAAFALVNFLIHFNHVRYRGRIL